MNINPKDLVGQRYGRLLVTGLAGVNRSKQLLWHCQCDCGNTHRTNSEGLKRGYTTSCGCYRRERISATKRTHGLSEHPWYMSWYEMMSKCYREENPRYDINGAVGIKVCKRWHTFANFIADMPDRPPGYVLVRHDKDGNFTPANCFWGPRTLVLRKFPVRHPDRRKTA